MAAAGKTDMVLITSIILIQKLKLDEVFTFDNGHICRTEPKGLRKFFLDPISNALKLRIDLNISIEGEDNMYFFEHSVRSGPLRGKFHHRFLQT